MYRIRLVRQKVQNLAVFNTYIATSYRRVKALSFDSKLYMKDFHSDDIDFNNVVMAVQE